MKRILVIGSGGREHAIVWALRQTSPVPLELFCAPGNAGIGQLAQLVNVSLNDQQELAAFAESNSIDLTFVGPEAPLTAGIVDAFDARGLAVVGPPAAAARLEGSKIFAKDFMARHGIPTAVYRVADSPGQAIEALRSGDFGGADSAVVIKADGLAAGKGVVVAATRIPGHRRSPPPERPAAARARGDWRTASQGIRWKRVRRNAVSSSKSANAASRKRR